MPRRLSKELTHKEMIDPQLEKAGWYLHDHSRLKIEILLDTSTQVKDATSPERSRRVEGLFEALLTESFGGEK